MKKLINLRLILILVSFFVFAPIASHAQLDVNLSGTADSAINTNIDASTTVDTNVEIDTNINSDIEVDTKDDSEESESNSNTSLKINSFGIVVVSSSQVDSEADLKIFSSNISEKEKAVAKVEIDSDESDELEVKVVYKHNGRLFGFIPVTVKSTNIVEIKANSETEVHSKLSWWSFLVAKKNYVKSDLEARIKNNSIIKANAKVDVSAKTKAQIAEAIIAEVKAHANAQSSVNK